jgi:anti-sigma B factor antagonist
MRNFTMADDFDEPTDSVAAAVRDKFVVRTSWVDRVAVLSVSDAVDLLTAPKLTEAIGEALAARPTAVIVDLSDVDFLASAGMSTLLTAQEETAKSARFAVVADGPATSRPIKLLGIDGALGLQSSLDEALLAVSNGGSG